MTSRTGRTRLLAALLLTSVLWSGQGLAEIDGHGPDAWRVRGVAASDALNMRMGPGTEYGVLGTFRANEHGLQQVTCVPYVPAARYMTLSEAEQAALPPRWCLMRSRDLTKAGWVRATFLVPDYGGAERAPANNGEAQIREAEDVVRALYEAHRIEDAGGKTDLRRPRGARRYFFADVAADFLSGRAGADPVYGGQDFDGSCQPPRRDPQTPMLRGMITVNVDCVNFGHAQRAVYRLRADPDQPGAPIRIFRIEHDGWSFP
ncbi:SH3 domain-containing protein [Stappia indica]|uniref:hypothetical protein n=1 Tax=Stappia indica TaxID=538381 RepID=UPI001CD71C99|nr:hypothetical protein [Stappia indica]MCA1297069.1 hypothetical protein [Stappia indica]